MILIKEGTLNVEKLEHYGVRTFVEVTSVWIKIEFGNPKIAKDVAKEIVI